MVKVLQLVVVGVGLSVVRSVDTGLEGVSEAVFEDVLSFVVMVLILLEEVLISVCEVATLLVLIILDDFVLEDIVIEDDIVAEELVMPEPKAASI